MPHNSRDAVRAHKSTKPGLPKLGSFRHNTLLRAPYLRPDENPRALAAMARLFRREFQPANAEDEAVVNLLTYIQWRIQRFQRDRILIEEHGAGDPDQAAALQCASNALIGLRQLDAWAMTSLQFLRRLQALDTVEAMEAKALNPELGLFVKNVFHPHGAHIRAPLPPETKPN